PGRLNPRFPPAGPRGHWLLGCMRQLQRDPQGRHKFAYFPFGGGPRVFFGNTFAMLEGPLVVAAVIQQFQVELVPGQTVVADPTFTPRPKYGVKVRLRPWWRPGADQRGDSGGRRRGTSVHPSRLRRPAVAARDVATPGGVFPGP